MRIHQTGIDGATNHTTTVQSVQILVMMFARMILNVLELLLNKIIHC